MGLAKESLGGIPVDTGVGVSWARLPIAHLAYFLRGHLNCAPNLPNQLIFLFARQRGWAKRVARL
jgi:hypothetical protein